MFNEPQQESVNDINDIRVSAVIRVSLDMKIIVRCVLFQIHDLFETVRLHFTQKINFEDYL